MRWVIGDIHGMLKPLNALLDAITRQDSSARVIFVGDYVNRGPEAPGVVDRLISLSKATYLRGNHDDIFDLIVNGKNFIDRNPNAENGTNPIPARFEPLLSFHWFMNHGLADTLVAYGVKYPALEDLFLNPTPEKLEKTMEIVPQKHRDFFRSLQGYAEYDKYFVAHAYWEVEDNDADLSSRLMFDARLRYQLLWGRFTGAQILANKSWSRIGYFGHTPVVNYRLDKQNIPIQGPNIVLLDTGAVLGTDGRLSAVCCDSGELIQVSRDGATIT